MSKKPAWDIQVIGATWSPDANRLVQSITITDNSNNESDRLVITFDDSKHTIALPEKGAALTIATGFTENGQTTLHPRGTFKVDHVRQRIYPAGQLTLTASAADFSKNLKVRRTQSYHDTTVGEVLTALAQRHSLDTKLHPSLSQQAIVHLDQTNESDGSLLARLAKRYSAVGQVKNNTLIFNPENAGTNTSQEALPNVEMAVGKDFFTELTYSQPQRNQFTGVLAYWRDDESGERVEVLAGDDTQPKRITTTWADAETAAAEANAEWLRIQRAGATLKIQLSQARPEVYAETPLTVAKTPSHVANVQWVPKMVTHQITTESYSLSMECKPKG